MNRKPRHLPWAQFVAQFKARLAAPDERGCAIWTGPATDGYGSTSWNRRTYRCHRLAWSIANGDIPAGALICHTCDNSMCCNPAHLYAGTLADNTADRVTRNRSVFGARVHNAKLTDAMAREIIAKYATGTFSQAALSRMYSINRERVWSVINGTAWKHIHEKGNA